MQHETWHCRAAESLCFVLSQDMAVSQSFAHSAASIVDCTIPQGESEMVLIVLIQHSSHVPHIHENVCITLIHVFTRVKTKISI